MAEYPSFQRMDRLPVYAFDSVIQLMRQARAQGRDIIDLGMGNPDGPSPEPVVDKLVEVAQRGDTHRYSRSAGIPRLRAAICDWYRRHYDVQLDPDTQAIVTMGSKEGLAHLALACVGPGDTVLVPSPAYPVHSWGMIIAGADVRHLPIGGGEDAAEEFLRRIEEAVRDTSPKPVMLLLNFPSNPTTACVDLDFYRRVVEIARREKLWVVQDLAYADLMFDGSRAPSILQVPGAEECAVEFFSMSKSYNMPGWRVGFCCGCAKLVGALRSIKTYLDYGIFTPVQVAAITALKECDQEVERTRKKYESRARALCDGLQQAGWPVAMPRATMFVWAPLPDKLRAMGSLAAAEKLLTEADVAVSPGVSFGPQGEGHVRMALIENEQRIRQATRSIRRYLESLPEPAAVVEGAEGPEGAGEAP